MRYPIAIEPGTKASAFGVVIPDLPGCFSAGDSLDEAVAGAQEAAAAWIEAALDGGQAIPAPTGLDALRRRPEFAGWAFGVITLSAADAVRCKLKRLSITEADVAEAVPWSRHRR